ncbi:ribonuclease H-like domain-containing protein [Tanacetum coccineum]
MAFMTAPSTSSTNDVNTAKPAYEVSTVSPHVNTTSPQVSIDNFSDNAINGFEVTTLSAKYEGKESVSTIIRRDTLPGNVEHQGTKISDMAEEQVQTNMDLMVFSDSKQLNTTRFVYTAKTSHPSAHKNMVLRAVLLKSGLTPLNTARYFHQKANTVMGHYYTVRPRAVNIARPYTAPVNVVMVKRVNVVKTSACKPQLGDKGFIDSGCSRHMTGNIAYLSDFKEFDRGYVRFRGGTHGGRISSKGTLKIDCLDFEDVYFVNELKFNLFSVSQMCDKKNYVLFTDTECLVLSPNFKLPDQSQILLKIPRKDNMYSFDMKNIVPKENLTCLVAKATLDESMLWHRRLGHINFKNINKLVKENFVRGLPSKHFENDQTCVACLKGKQHRASLLLGQKVNTASTNINAATLALVMLEGNSVFLITIEIFKALTSFIGFQEIVDFLNRSTLRYALITNPTIYTSQIKQFWQTATVKTLNSREVEIKATIDGHDKTITEASVRSSLQLADADGISNMSTTGIFKQLALMGFKSTGWDQFSSNIATALILADEATFTSVDVDAGGAATTKISLDAGQGSGIIHKTTTGLNDAPLSKVNTPRSAEGSLSQTKLTDLVLKLSKKVEGLETKLKNTKQIYGKISASKEAHSSDISPEDQLEVSSATKILADAGKSDTFLKIVLEVQTYTRRRRDVIDVNTGSKAVNTGSIFLVLLKLLLIMLISHDEEVAQKLYAEELAKDTTRQEQEKNDLEKALELKKHLDERVEVVAKVNQAYDIDWSDPAVLRYHALQNRSFSVAEVKKNMCTYLKNQGGYKQSHFKGMSYEDIRPIFESAWDQNHAFVLKDSEIEKEVMKRPGFDLQQESIKKNKKIEALVISDSEEIISVIPLAVKSPIVNLKSYSKGDVGYYEIHKADGSYKTYIYFSFDDLVLKGDMKIMFEPDGDDAVWKNHHSQKLIERKLYDSCGVHSLMLGEGKERDILLQIDDTWRRHQSKDG